MHLNPPPHPDRLAEDPWTAPFWAATLQRRIVVCECANCLTLRMPPGPFCPQCQSQAIGWKEVPGTGTIYSYTVVHRAVSPASAHRIPYAPAVVALDTTPGIRLVSAIVESAVEDLRIDARVRPSWHVLPDGHVVPYFTIA